MNIDIEKIIEDEGKNIANDVFKKYGEHLVIKHKSIFAYFWDSLLGGSITRLKIREDIYERGMHKANAFFLKNERMKFDNKIIEVIKFHLKTRLERTKKLEKLSKEEMLANAININALDALIDKGLIV
jgi:hypothetical protein